MRMECGECNLFSEITKAYVVCSAFYAVWSVSINVANAECEKSILYLHICMLYIVQGFSYTIYVHTSSVSKCEHFYLPGVL